MTALQKGWKSLAEQPWQVMATQLAAIFRVEFKRNFFRRRGLWMYFLAFAPVVVIGLHGIQSPRGIRCSIEQDTRILAIIFQLFYLRLGIFFGAMGIFTWLMRGEMVENTLHYYLLVPIRRELLVLGKFLAGLATCAALFGGGVFLSFFFMYSHFGPRGAQFVFDGPGLGHLFAYLGVTVLACIGYGALSVALSLLVKNPAVPGIIILSWETLSGVLPSFLQKFSVTYYLKHLSPVAIQPDGILALFTVVTKPVPQWAAVLGLLLFASGVLAFACWRARILEISYATD